MQERSHYGMSCPVQPGVQCDMNKLGDMEKEDFFFFQRNEEEELKTPDLQIQCSVLTASTSSLIQQILGYKFVSHWLTGQNTLLHY